MFQVPGVIGIYYWNQRLVGNSYSNSINYDSQPIGCVRKGVNMYGFWGVAMQVM